MRINRFIGNFDFSLKVITIYEESILNQVMYVLRMQKGEKIILSDGKGKEVLGEVLHIQKDRIDVNILEEREDNNDPDIRAFLYCSILKQNNFEWVVQKGCEVGVAGIIPIIAERTVKTRLREERLRTIIREAAEQSERKILPYLSFPLDYSEALQQVSKDECTLFFHRAGYPIEKTISKKRPSKVNFFIGPEGGWTEKEVRMANEHHFKIISLSRLNFRSETAAIIASYLVCQDFLR